MISADTHLFSQQSYSVEETVVDVLNHTP